MEENWKKITEETHQRFMEEAYKEALKAEKEGEIPVGAVIVSEGLIIARGHNLTEKLTDATAHAEMQCFTAASSHLGGKYLQDCVLYVTLEPCLMCAGAAFWTQISGVVYGASDPKRGFLMVEKSILHPKSFILGGIMGEACGNLLKNFFLRKRAG